jgi:hypothetical protein
MEHKFCQNLNLFNDKIDGDMRFMHEPKRMKQPKKKKKKPNKFKIKNKLFNDEDI